MKISAKFVRPNLSALARMRVDWRFGLKSLTLAGMAAVAGFYGFETGSILAQRDLTRMNGRIEDLSQTIGQLEKYNLVLAEAADEAKLSEAQWRQRYEKLASNRKFNRLFDQAKKESADGVDASRLTVLVDSARVGAQCEDLPVVKSFKVNTPVSENGSDSAGFAENQIVISANGISAINRTGRPLAWFDPKQPVAVRFNTMAGNSSVASGILPITHTVVTDESEYRFEVGRGPRGFVKVGGSQCRFDP